MDTVYLGSGSDSFAGGAGADTVHVGTTATNITQTIVGGVDRGLHQRQLRVGATTRSDSCGYTQFTLGSGQTVDVKSNGTNTVNVTFSTAHSVT